MTRRLPQQDRQKWLADKVAAAQEVLRREVEALQSGEDWRRFLDFQERLHAYSPNNVLLICSQHAQAFETGRVPSPFPTYLAGFRTWQALGRQVEKGQHGYGILAPLHRKERMAVDEAGNARRLAADEKPAAGEVEHTQPVIRGFGVQYVFDLSQTTGEPVPVPPAPKLLEGDAPRGLIHAVWKLVEQRGFRVALVPNGSDLQGAKGQTDHGERTVLVRGDMDDAAIAKTLIHEAGHVLLHDVPPGALLTRRQKEVEAESVAYVVAAAHGMSTGDYSFPYVAGWAGPDGSDAVIMAQSRVAIAARTILDVSPAETTPGGKVPDLQRATAAAWQGPTVDIDPDPILAPSGRVSVVELGG